MKQERDTKESYYKFYRDVDKMSKSMIVIRKEYNKTIIIKKNKK